MWYKRQILAELRAYTSQITEPESAPDAVRSYVTRTIVRERSYQKYAKNFSNEKEKEDNTEPSQEAAEDAGNTKGLGREEEDISSAFTAIDLNGDITDSVSENNHPHLLEQDSVVENGDSSEKLTVPGESLTETDCNHSNKAFDFEEDDPDCSMMELMGLPTNFGPQKVPKKKKLSEKQIRGKFTDLWDDHGELMLYKAFVSIYPDYAGYYDQITGSIPPSEEVEVICSNGITEDDGIETIDRQEGDKIESMDQSAVPCSNGHEVNNSGDFNINDKNDKISTDTISSNGVENTSKNIKASENLDIKSNCETICNGHVPLKDNNGLSEVDNVSPQDKTGLLKDDISNFIDTCDNPSDECVQNDSKVNNEKTVNGETICENGEEGKETPSNLFVNEHSYVSEHSYSNINGEGNHSKEKYFSEDYAEQENETQYTHEELIQILRGTHQDLENQIYWHTKETVSDWYRQNPGEDFDITSLDEDILAITYPYMQYQGEGEEEGGWEEGEEEEYEDCYAPYAEEQDEDIVDDEGKEANLSAWDTLKLCGFAVEKVLEIRQQSKRKIVHATTTYKRKNIKKEAKRLRLDLATAPPRHIFFDDDGNAIKPAEEDKPEGDSQKEEEDLSAEDNPPSTEADLPTEDEPPGVDIPKRKHIIFSEDDEEVDAKTSKKMISDNDSEPEEKPIKHELLTKPQRKVHTLLEERSRKRLSKKRKRNKSAPEGQAYVTSDLTSTSWDDRLTSAALERLVEREKIEPFPQEVPLENSSVNSYLWDTYIPGSQTPDNKQWSGNVFKNIKSDLSLKERLEICGAIHPAQNKEIVKYWHQRYTLFQRYDEGILMDKESWFSVTPEPIAAYIARRCQGRTVLDGFCGAGGNIIQFALLGCKVIAIDNDPNKIKLAKHNAQVYGVHEHIEFICGDFMEEGPKCTDVDVVFLSPPWGGPQYKDVEVYDVENMNSEQLMKVARQVSQNIAFYVPRNTDTQQLIMLAADADQKEVELEQVFIEKNNKAMMAYYGDLINNQS